MASGGGASSSTAMATANGPPYAPRTQALGEVPSVVPDVPVNVIFLLLFIMACTAHATLFRRNASEGKKFWISLMVVGFCLTRIVATVLRIVWALEPTDVSLAIAATISVYAGIVLLFLANFLFAQRLVRAQHPRFGWSKPFTLAFPALVIITISTVICLIAAVFVKSFSLHPSAQHAATVMQRYGATWLAFFAFLPVAMAGSSALARKHPHIRMTKTIDKFGKGSMRAKVAVVVGSGLLLCLGASFRAGAILAPAVPILLSTSPVRPAPEPAYLSKACFYIFNFTIEICICFFWLAVRVDKRFHIPDGASGAFSYAGGFVFAGEAGNEKKRLSAMPGSQPSLNPPDTALSRDSRRGSRLSFVSQQSRQERLERLENRISWGGVSSEAIRHILAEDGKRQIPYPVVGESCTLEDITIDMEDGAPREMGFDPKSGRYALRPVVSNSGRISRTVSLAPSSELFELP